MEFGIHFIDFLPGDNTALGPTLVKTAQASEEAGASVFTLADHFFQMYSDGTRVKFRRPRVFSSIPLLTPMPI